MPVSHRSWPGVDGVHSFAAAPILKGDSGVVGVQLQRGAGGVKPLLGPGRALLAVGGLGDHLLQPSSPGSNQRVGIGVAFQHRQVGLAEFASQWRHRHELTDQVLDAPLVAGCGLGQPVTNFRDDSHLLGHLLSTGRGQARLPVDRAGSGRRW